MPLLHWYEYDPEAFETMKAYYNAIEALKEEAVHLVRSMPRWEPSRRNGLRFETEMTIPLYYRLVTPSGALLSPPGDVK